MNLSQRLVAHCLELKTLGLPRPVQEQVLLHVADAMAIGWAATACSPLAGQLTRAVAQGSEGGSCRVFGSAHRLPPALAAFENAALIHTLDFDDIHDVARLHIPRPSPCSPAALAAAELNGAKLESVTMRRSRSTAN